MSTILLIGAATFVFAIGASAGDWSQLVSAAGLTPAQAEGMTLTELAARKFNRESAGDDDVTVSSRSYPVFDVEGHRQLVAAAGLRPRQARAMTLTEITSRKVNLGTGKDEGISLARRPRVGFDPAEHPQLVARAGLTPAEAEGMTLDEIVVRKINRERRGDDR